MDKVYLKDGNSRKSLKGNRYCKSHFIEKYGREPNIQDVASLGFCKMCKYISPNEWD